MLRIIVTGKPKGFTNVKQKDGSKITAVFTLVERRWISGQWVEVYWKCCVPAHKETWARGQTEKGYTVAVEADDFFVREIPDAKNGAMEYVLMVTGVTGL